jgi:tetratricopeptide (TPR) repeat protein
LEARLTGSEQRALAARPTENAEAYELYLKGRFFWNKRSGSDLLTALDYFQRAYAADPNFAGAHAGAAEACVLIPNYSAGRPQEYFQKGKVEARRAIELDANSAEGHTALAALLWTNDMNSAGSEKEFRRAIELNPNYATAHHWYGNTLLVSLGRFDEAIEEGKRAIELDPLSLIINADLGSTLMVARRYDEAITQLRHTLTLDDNFYYAHWNLGEALYYKGDIAGAITEFEKARELDHDPEALALLGRAYAESGKREQALKVLEELKEVDRHSYVSPRLFALIYIGLGDKAKAIEALEAAYQTHTASDLIWIKVDPRFDPLRDERRFQQLVSRVFPESRR